MKNDKQGKISHDLPFIVQRVYSYYLKGLTGKEIAILCKISARTAQRIIKNNNFKQMANPKPLKERCFEMSKNGFSYTQIARQMKISKSTVYNYIKELKKEI